VVIIMVANTGVLQHIPIRKKTELGIEHSIGGISERCWLPTGLALTCLPLNL
jgi:hypothetical protein